MSSKPKADSHPRCDDKEPTAAIVTVGNELLSGIIENSNATWMARELVDCGVGLRVILTLPDEVPVIAEALGDLSADFTYVFVTGGVGPTPDDVTREAVAQAVGAPLVEHAEMGERLRGIYGSAFKERVLVMARLPEGAELLSGDDRIFPGFSLRNLFVFPGIPELMKANFALIKHRFQGTPFHSKTLSTSLDESSYAHLLDKVITAFPKVLFGSYPHLRAGRFTATVMLRSRDASHLEEAWRWLQERWPE